MCKGRKNRRGRLRGRRTQGPLPEKSSCDWGEGDDGETQEESSPGSVEPQKQGGEEKAGLYGERLSCLRGSDALAGIQTLSKWGLCRACSSYEPLSSEW